VLFMPIDPKSGSHPTPISPAGGLGGPMIGAMRSVLLHPDVLRRASQIVPTLLLQFGVRFVPHLPAPAVTVVENVAAALTVLCVALSQTGLLPQRRP